ncbi:MAG: hypothetical protein RIA98_04070 [Algiphilus sp.]|uniref:hypothetical protein n=1 Tax=Algiphilus sp. TaxID=1872431 RepID=UPI0032EEDB20
MSDHGDGVPYEPMEVDIPITRLLLDEENFRIDIVDNQRSAIMALLKQQGEGRKILNLAKHIVEKGRLAPGERLLIIQNDEPLEADEADDDFYVVMEGNRRVSCLKLLNNPALIQNDYPNLYKKFSELSKNTDRRLLEEVPCVVLPDRDIALEWVEIKHSTDLDGVGLEKWDAGATARFSERRGRYRRWRIAINTLADAGYEIDDIYEGIRDKTTAAERVFGAKAMKDILGVLFKNNEGLVNFENGDERAGCRLLNEMLTSMSSEEFKTATVHSLSDREAFISKFLSMSVKMTGSSQAAPQPRNETSKPESSSQSTGHQGSSKAENTKETGDRSQKQYDDKETKRKRPRLRWEDRKTLALVGYEETFHVKDPSINSLYHEARKLQVKSAERIAAILTRVFLEVTCDSYLVELRIPIAEDVRRKGINMWPDAPLKRKLQEVIGCLDPNKSYDDLKVVRKALGSDEWMHSVSNLHSFVHDRLATISDVEVKQIWQRYHPLFKRAHTAITENSGVTS